MRKYFFAIIAVALICMPPAYARLRAVGSGAVEIVEDLTPQLGGDLDVQDFNINNIAAILFDNASSPPSCTAPLEGNIFYNSSSNHSLSSFSRRHIRVISSWFCG